MFRYPIPKAKTKNKKQAEKERRRRQEEQLEYQQQQQILPQQQQQQHQPYTPSPSPPSLHTTQNLSSWFDFFDTDGGGTLDREEVIRGLQRTLGCGHDGRSDPQTVRDTVFSVWCIFDHDGSGAIDRAEFLAEGGLGESLVAMVNSMPAAGNGVASGGGEAMTGPIAEVEPEIEVMPSSSYDHERFMGVPIPAGIGPGRMVNVTLRPGDAPRQLAVPGTDEWHYGSDGRPYFLTPTADAVTPEVPLVHAMPVPPPYVPGNDGGGLSYVPAPVVPDYGASTGGGEMPLPMPPPYNPNAAGYR